MRIKFLGIICILYSLMILYIWLTDQLKNFLAPQMQLYIKLAIIPLLIIGIVLLLSKNQSRFVITDIILLLPIILLIISGDGRLSASFASNRATTMNRNKTKVVDKTTKPKEESKVEQSYNLDRNTYNFSKPDFKIEDFNYGELSGYLSFSPNAEKYAGSTITVKGFAIEKPDFTEKGYSAIGKYLVSCCVADASFSGFIIKTEEKIKDNKWYDIEGVLEKGQDKDGVSLMYINVINIKEIKKNNEPEYVYPCYSYGEKKCQELNKYMTDY